MPVILALIGSLRAQSHNKALARAAQEVAPSDLDITLATTDGVPVFNEDLEVDGTLPPAIQTLGAAILASDGVLVLTPEYNYALPGGLKNVLDWLSRDPRAPMRGRPVAVGGATIGSGGTRQAQAQLRHVLHVLGAHLVPTPYLEISHADQRFDATGRLTDPATRAQVNNFLHEFVECLRPLRNHQTPARHV